MFTVACVAMIPKEAENVSVLQIEMKWLTMLLASFVFDFSWAAQINSNATVFILFKKMNNLQMA